VKNFFFRARSQLAGWCLDSVHFARLGLDVLSILDAGKERANTLARSISQFVMHETGPSVLIKFAYLASLAHDVCEGVNMGFSLINSVRASGSVWQRTSPRR
jgi:hypothetical protein